VRIEQLTLPPLIWGLVLAIGLFASVTLHELAHTLAAMAAARPSRSAPGTRCSGSIRRGRHRASIRSMGSASNEADVGHSR
jgi:hypothetical protein